MANLRVGDLTKILASVASDADLQLLSYKPSASSPKTMAIELDVLMGALARYSGERTPLDPYYGTVDPTGVADSRAAFMNFIEDICLNGAGRRGFIPPGSYLIDGYLDVPYSQGWD